MYIPHTVVLADSSIFIMYASPKVTNARIVTGFEMRLSGAEELMRRRA